MKKINSFILFGAAVFAFAACSNDTQIENSPKNNGPVYETLSVKVGNEATTRVTLEGTNNAKSVFETGDQIAVWTPKNGGEFQTCAVDGTGKISVDISGGARSNYAVYYNGATAPTFNGTDLTITLPDAYYLADVSGDKNPVPMVAVNDATDANDMTFYAVCGLLRMTVNNIPPSAKRLGIDFNGKKVCGAFTIASTVTPGTSAIETSVDASNDMITITRDGTDATLNNDAWLDGLVLNIPLPAGDYTNVTVTAYDALTSGNVILTMSAPIKDGGYTAVRAHGKKLTAGLPAFSVSGGKRVAFAPGNLYTDETTGALHMADNYYEHIYAFSANGDYANDNVTYSKLNRTHFNFNETYLLMKTGALSDNSDAYMNADTYDLTRNDIDGGGAYSWRVPSLDDWTAMTTGARPGATLNATITSTSTSSSTAGWKFVKVVVSGMGTAGTSTADGSAALAADKTEPETNYQAGLLIFPDNVEIDGTFTTLGSQNATGAANNSTTITKDNLDALITAGCAFLPSVGRFSNGFGLVGKNGGYWSSTQVDDTEGYYLNFGAGNVNTSNNLKSSVFRSVRLVRDL